MTAEGDVASPQHMQAEEGESREWRKLSRELNILTQQIKNNLIIISPGKLIHDEMSRVRRANYQEEITDFT